MNVLLAKSKLGGGGGFHMKGVGMLNVLAREVISDFWSHLGYSGENTVICSPYCMLIIVPL